MNLVTTPPSCTASCTTASYTTPSYTSSGRNPLPHAIQKLGIWNTALRIICSTAMAIAAALPATSWAADGIVIPPESFPSARIVLKKEDSKSTTNRVTTVISRDAADWESFTKTEDSSYSTKFVGDVVESDIKGATGARFTVQGTTTNTTSFASSNPLTHWPTGSNVSKVFLTHTDTEGVFRSQLWENGVYNAAKSVQRNIPPGTRPSASSESNMLCRREYDLSFVGRSPDGFITTNSTGKATTENVPKYIIEFVGGDPLVKFRNEIAVRYNEIPSGTNEARFKVLTYEFIAMGESPNGARGGARYFSVPLPFVFECQTIDIGVRSVVGGPLDELTKKDEDHDHKHQ